MSRCVTAALSPLNTTRFVKDASVSGGTKQSDLLIGQTAHVPSTNNGGSTEPSGAQGWPGPPPPGSKAVSSPPRLFPPLGGGSLPQVQREAAS